jgi:NADPH-dependent curcumin reductase CurA
MRRLMGSGWQFPGASLAIGQVMPGDVVGQVIVTRNPKFEVGDYVAGNFGWQLDAVSSGSGVRKLDPELAPLTTALGILGMPGMTAYFGLLEVGQPRSGETVVVSAASGAVGGLVGQIAQLKGCRTVGTAGSQEKCVYLVDELGYDAAINYRLQNVEIALEETCPSGIDVYFDNVGGLVLKAVLKYINVHARIVVCGMISEYHSNKPEAILGLARILHDRRARMEGFLVGDYLASWPEGISQMNEWLAAGQVKYREDVVEGLENAPQAFIGLFRGRNFGKLLVKLQ